MRLSYLRSGVDMADVRSDAGGVGDIVEGEGGDEGVKLHEEGEWLTDPSRSSQDRHLPLMMMMMLHSLRCSTLKQTRESHGVCVCVLCSSH